MQEFPRILYALALTALFSLPVQQLEALRASRCGVDGRCTCIEWTWVASSEIEVRCPDGGGASGWTRPAPAGQPPDVIDPGGSFRGNGQLETGHPSVVPPASINQQLKIRNAKTLALQALRLPECAALFANSPLSLDGPSILNRIEWLNGEEVRPHNRCDEPDGAPAYYADVGRHVPRIYVCNSIRNFSDSAVATLLIHEALHVAGQGEDGTAAAGPGNYPSSLGISFVVADACNLNIL